MQAVIEAAKVAIGAIREVGNLVNNGRPVHAITTSGGPAIKQAIFDCKAGYIYKDVYKIEVEVKNIS